MIIVRKNEGHDFYLVSLDGGLSWVKTSKRANTIDSLIKALKKIGNEIQIQD